MSQGKASEHAGGGRVEDRHNRRSPSLSLIRIGLLRPLLEMMGKSGVNVPAMVGRTGLARLPRDLAAFYPFGDAMTLINQAALRSGIEHLGYVFAQAQGLRSLGPFGEFVAGAPTLYRATLRANATIRWVSPFSSLTMLRDGPSAIWQIRHPERSNGYNYHGSLHAIYLMTELLRLAAPAGWRPTEIRIGERAHLSPVLEQLVGAPLRFVENEWSIVFPRSLLALPMRRPSWCTANYTHAALEETALAADLAVSVRALARSMLATGQANEELFARIMDLPKRTFQRRFHDLVGAPFRSFLAELRFQEAQRLIADPQSRLRDVAAALGYTEQANFTRAFAKWSGMSPTEYRLQIGIGSTPAPVPETGNDAPIEKRA